MFETYRKRYRVTLFTAIAILLAAIMGIVIFANKDYLFFSKPNQELTQEQKDFNALFDRVQKLEELSKDFNEENYQLRAVRYIRSSKYTGMAWNMLLGTVEPEFVTYVQNNQGSYNLEGLRTVDYFVDPKTGNQIDFVHMFASMEGFISEQEQISDLTGWAGDLCQVAGVFKNVALTGSALDIALKENFNNSNATDSNGYAVKFSSADVTADFDAVNIANIYNTIMNKSSISESVKFYYSVVTEQSRKTMFKENCFGTSYDGKTDLTNKIYDRMSANMGITTYCQLGEGFNFASKETLIRACISVFVDYIY